MSQYLLAPHVYLCVTDDHVVLLDLKRDKYIGVGRAHLRVLQQCVKGWPAFTSAGADAAPAVASADSMLSRMLASGMLTTDPARGKEALPVTVPPPLNALGDPEPAPGQDPFDARPKIGARQVFNFALACFRARVALRLRPIAAVVAHAAARKARHARPQRSLDLQAVRQHVAAYVHLRPWLFTAKDACLFDALALGNYLARYGIFATWVFGVQTGPFAAHCWLQHDELVLNDTPDNVRRYAPILAV